ncbi:unnamed protein product [Zymoseptoria tritici ST99CH_3D1]|nr:unnamed protein product [Zymoseptoria tritici ST99CH_3D1]
MWDYLDNALPTIADLTPALFNELYDFLAYVGWTSIASQTTESEEEEEKSKANLLKWIRRNLGERDVGRGERFAAKVLINRSMALRVVDEVEETGGDAVREGVVGRDGLEEKRREVAVVAEDSITDCVLKVEPRERDGYGDAGLDVLMEDAVSSKCTPHAEEENGTADADAEAEPVEGESRGVAKLGLEQEESECGVLIKQEREEEEDGEGRGEGRADEMQAISGLLLRRGGERDHSAVDKENKEMLLALAKLEKEEHAAGKKSSTVEVSFKKKEEKKKEKNKKELPARKMGKKSRVEKGKETEEKEKRAETGSFHERVAGEEINLDVLTKSHHHNDTDTANRGTIAEAYVLLDIAEKHAQSEAIPVLHHQIVSAGGGTARGHRMSTSREVVPPQSSPQRHTTTATTIAPTTTTSDKATAQEILQSLFHRADALFEKENFVGCLVEISRATGIVVGFVRDGERAEEEVTEEEDGEEVWVDDDGDNDSDEAV